MTSEFKIDFLVNTGENYSFFRFIKHFLLHHEIRFLYFYRKNNLIGKIILRKIKTKYGLEINSKEIGAGLYIGHPYGINVNGGCKIGKNCNIHKGVTIGQENRGKRKGCPTLGNYVWCGVNSTIVGKINIGDDVLIAPNSYVNQDIPPHSIVFGNPCLIKERNNATEYYIKKVI